MVYSTRLPLDPGFDLRRRPGEGGTMSRNTSIEYYRDLYGGLRSKQRRSIKGLTLVQNARMRWRTYNRYEYGLVVGISKEIEDV